MNLRTFASNLNFGTSGVRGLVESLSRENVCAYVIAFLRHLQTSAQIKTDLVVIGWDLRPSSPLIAAHVADAAASLGFIVEIAGLVPTPALALRCLKMQASGIMVTGSHIPFDRNGIKFYTWQGEILKSDEQAMLSQKVDSAQLSPCISAASTSKIQGDGRHSQALQDYRERYISNVPSKCLTGLKVGVYQHSAVGRDFLHDLLVDFGAHVVPLGRSETFVPIDTEAVSLSDEAQAASWCLEHRLDAVVSTDGDGDRPWVCDERGRFVRGDILGLLTAHWLKANTVVTPVSSNTSLEKSNLFALCERTRIGSPYVIEAMQQLQLSGCSNIVGFEANGGFLVQSEVGGWSPLPTRDSTLPVLAILISACKNKQPLSAVVAQYQLRFADSGRLQNIDPERSQALIARLTTDQDALSDFLQFSFAQPQNINTTDGLRVSLTTDDIVHLRPSGNAPELRCYTESSTPEGAKLLLTKALEQLSSPKFL